MENHFFTLTRYDEETPRGTVILEGRCHWGKDEIRYEEELTGGKNIIHFDEAGIMLRRIAEIETVTELVSNRTGTSVITSAFGDMELTAELIRYETEENRVLAEYRLLQGEDVVLWQTLEWKRKGSENE